jgi:hypothetical protein
MKAKKILATVFAMFCLSISNIAASAPGVTDNEILIEQVGNTLTLTIIQDGYGNKISGDASDGTDLVITGAGLTIDIDQVGNSNKFYGDITSDNSTLNWTFTGSSNIWDNLIGDTGSTDDSDILVTVTGDSNTVDFDLGSVVSAERLDMDFVMVGDSNVFDVDIEVDDATWDVDLTGDSNNFVTSLTDGAYQYLKVIHDGDGGDFDILMSSGTCPTGINSCYGHIDLDIDSNNATVQITVSD